VRLGHPLFLQSSSTHTTFYYIDLLVPRQLSRHDVMTTYLITELWGPFST
jgi:hypothetical protein